MVAIPDKELRNVVLSLGGKAFSTYDFILALQRKYPTTWAALEAEYGAGGEGAGTYYTAYSRAAQALGEYSNSGGIARLEYRKRVSGKPHRSGKGLRFLQGVMTSCSRRAPQMLFHVSVNSQTKVH